MDIAELKNELSQIPKAKKQAFEQAFSDWKNTWFTGERVFSSDTKDFAQGSEFNALLNLGQSTIPLVLEKIMEPTNFVALVLYDALQTDNELKIACERGEPCTLEGEVARAQRTLQKLGASLNK